MAEHTVLIVDDEEDVRDVVRLTLELCADVHVIEASTAAEAESLLKETKGVSLIIGDYSMPGETGLDLYNKVKAQANPVPFILLSSDAPIEEFSGDAFFGYVEKPNFVEPLTEMVKKYFDQAAPLSIETKSKAGDFVPIRLALLLKIGVIGYDLYLKMSDRKFVKVFHPDNQFEPLDSKRFSEKNIQNLYLRHEDALAFLRDFERVVAATSDADNIKDDSVFEVSKATNEIIMSVAKSFGWSEDVQRLTKRNVKLAMRLVKKNPKIRQLIKEKLIDRDDYLPSHSLLIAHVACGFAVDLEWESKFTFFKISIAAILHDITLSDQEIERVFELDQRAARREFAQEPDVKKYKAHPKQASEMISGFAEMPPDVNKIIAQHHERPDGTGFPAGLAHMRINPIAVLFIFTEDFVNYLFDIDEFEIAVEQFLAERRELYSVGTFKKLYDIVREQFPELDAASSGRMVS